MTTQEIQDAKMLGSNYATEWHYFIYRDWMTADEFAAAALDNYNGNSDACGEPTLAKEYEADFLLGAKSAFKG